MRFWQLQCAKPISVVNLILDPINKAADLCFLSRKKSLILGVFDLKLSTTLLLRATSVIYMKSVKYFQVEKYCNSAKTFPLSSILCLTPQALETLIFVCVRALVGIYCDVCVCVCACSCSTH